jgi:hypothetical protein
MSRAGAILLLLAASALALAGCGPRGTPDLEGPSRAFFDRLSRGEVREAYGSLAEGSRGDMAFEEFAWTAEALELVGNRETEWGASERDGDEGRIEGTVATSGGTRLRLELVYERVGREWALRRFGDPAGEDRVARVLEAKKNKPAPEAMRRLAADTMQGLGQGLVEGDFGEFHARLEEAFAEETSPELFHDSFAWLADPTLAIEWGDLRGDELAFGAEPQVDMEGILTATGDVPAGKRKVGFELKWAYRSPDWKLASLIVRPPF